MKLFKPAVMKTILITSAAVLCIFASGCEKQSECIGTDCVYPEAVVAIDSISHNHIYTTLVNREGERLGYTLSLSPEVDAHDFAKYTGFHSQWPTLSRPNPDEERIL